MGCEISTWTVIPQNDRCFSALQKSLLGGPAESHWDYEGRDSFIDTSSIKNMTVEEFRRLADFDGNSRTLSYTDLVAAQLYSKDSRLKLFFRVFPCTGVLVHPALLEAAAPYMSVASTGSNKLDRDAMAIGFITSLANGKIDDSQIQEIMTRALEIEKTVSCEEKPVAIDCTPKPEPAPEPSLVYERPSFSYPTMEPGPNRKFSTETSSALGQVLLLGGGAFRINGDEESAVAPFGSLDLELPQFGDEHRETDVSYVVPSARFEARSVEGDAVLGGAVGVRLGHFYGKNGWVNYSFGVNGLFRRNSEDPEFKNRAGIEIDPRFVLRANTGSVYGFGLAIGARLGATTPTTESKWQGEFAPYLGAAYLF